MGSLWVMFSPARPASNSFRPIDGMCSYTVTATPAQARVSAAIKPAGPPPMTAADRVTARVPAGRVRGLQRATRPPN